MTEKHILHIEDNFHNRRIVRKILEKQGYVLHEAADGIIGFNMIREFNPPLVLLDISLPGMDGIEIAQKVKADDNLKHIILIAVTASAMQGDRERFLAAGCDDYLSKPFRSIDLIELINQYFVEMPEMKSFAFEPKEALHPIEERPVPADDSLLEEESESEEEETPEFVDVFEEAELLETIVEVEGEVEDDLLEDVREEVDSALPDENEEEGWVEITVGRLLQENGELPSEEETSGSIDLLDHEEPDESDVQAMLEVEDDTQSEEVEAADEIDSLEDSMLLKTASLEGIFSKQELDEHLNKDGPEIEEVEAVAESLDEAIDSETQEIVELETEAEVAAGDMLIGDKSSEEKTFDDEAVTWIMPRETEEQVEAEPQAISPVVDEPLEEAQVAEAADSLEDSMLLKTHSLQGIFTEEELDKYLTEDTPEIEEVEAVEEPLPESLETASQEIVEPETEAETAAGDSLFSDEAIDDESSDDETIIWVAPKESGESRDSDVVQELEVEQEAQVENEEQPEPAASYEEAETVRSASFQPKLAEDDFVVVEEDEAPEEVVADLPVDDTSPLKEQTVEQNIFEESLLVDVVPAPVSEDPSNGTSKLEQEPEKEKQTPQQKELMDKVIQMINPEMLRPVEPNVDFDRV